MVVGRKRNKLSTRPSSDEAEACVGEDGVNSERRWAEVSQRTEVIHRMTFLKTGISFFIFAVLMFVYRGHPFAASFLKWKWTAPSWFSTGVNDLQFGLFIVASVVTFACLIGIIWPRSVSKWLQPLTTNQTAVISYWLVYGLSFFGTWLKAYAEAVNQQNPYFTYFVVLVGLVLLMAVFWIMPLSFRKSPRRKSRTETLPDPRSKQVSQPAGLLKAWHKIAIISISKGPVQFFLVAVAVAIIQAAAFLFPTLSWLRGASSTDSFVKVLWQVHASVLGVTVVVVTIIITVIANEKDRTRTWKLYADKTRFLPIIWFNLLAILSEGVALLQTSDIANPGNLILSEGILFTLSILMAAALFTVTMRFLDDDYVEDLAEKRIMRAMPEAVERDLSHIEELLSGLQGEADGHRP